MYNELKAVAMELGLTEDEAELEVEDFLSATQKVEWVDLISFVGERAEHKRFTRAWNERYPKYPARVYSNPHDFGDYYSIQIANFGEAVRDEETFPQGPEEAASALADEMGLEY